MPEPSLHPDQHDLSFVAVPAERAKLLRDLIASARADLRPRNFPERHLVDMMAVCKWRLQRVLMMEKAIYQRELKQFRPKLIKNSTGHLLEPMEDLAFLAQAHTPERQAVVLAALSRLETRYHRDFCSALRHFLAVRKSLDLNPTPTDRDQTTCEI
jgi:hypothetical protein